MPRIPIDQPTPSDTPAHMDHAAVDALLGKVLAPWVKAMAIEAVEVSEALAILRLPYSPAFRHAGGAVAVQVLMAAVDTAMLVAVTAVLGAYQPMAAAALNISFLRPVQAGDVRIVARILRRLDNLLFVEVELYSSAGDLAAHATATYTVISAATTDGAAPRPD